VSVDDVRLVAAAVGTASRRQPRALRTAAVIAAVTAGTILLSAAATSRTSDQVAAARFRIAVSGDVAGAPVLLSDLRAHRNLRVSTLADGADPALAVRSSDVRAVLLLPRDADARLASGQPLDASVVYEREEDRSLEAYVTLRATIAEIAGGVQQASIIDLEHDQRGLRLLGARALATVLSFVALIGISTLAAGERGDRSGRDVEAMLLLPLPRTAIAAGSMLGLLPIAGALLGSALLVAIPLLSLPLAGLGQPASALPAMAAWAGAAGLLIVLPVTASAVAVRFSSATTGQAATVARVVSIAPALLLIVLLAQPGLQPSRGLLALPFLGPALLVRFGAAGDLGPLDLLVAAAGSAAGVLALLALSARLLASERNVLRPTT
jgi:hypothetical protein